MRGAAAWLKRRQGWRGVGRRASVGPWWELKATLEHVAALAVLPRHTADRRVATLQRRTKGPRIDAAAQLSVRRVDR